jgi:hypothetical protein
MRPPNGANVRKAATGLIWIVLSCCADEATTASGQADTTTGAADVTSGGDTDAGDDDATSALPDTALLTDTGSGSEEPPDATADAVEPDIESDTVVVPDTSDSPDTSATPDTLASLDADDEPDAAAPVDVESPVDAGAPIDAGSPAESSGETCADAVDLEAASEPTFSDYAYVVSGPLGESNDYNPFIDSGLPPACSIVYDAKGKERVYYIDLAPGEELELRMALTPATRPAGLYVLDGCDPVTWPDYDGSGKCGSNEYASEGFCGPVAECDPVELSVLHDADATETRRFYVVVDEVAGDGATGFLLYWNRVEAP